MRDIGLAEAIEELRRELGVAQDAGANQQLRFEVAEVEIELLVELTREGGGEAKVAFGVVSVGGNARASHANAHRLRLKLNVKDEALGGQTAVVTDDRERSFGE
jgi:NTP-dependent ternary system trypsin peptidase co-occuring protein